MLEAEISLAEHNAESAIDYLRRCSDGENSSVDSRNKYRKIYKNETKFLKDYFPSSHVLRLDVRDINMELER